jgi:hypothetical protein
MPAVCVRADDDAEPMLLIPKSHTLHTTPLRILLHSTFCGLRSAMHLGGDMRERNTAKKQAVSDLGE